MSASAASGGVAVGIVDPSTGSAIAITFAHAKVHSGESFISDFVDESLGSGAKIVLAFKTPPAIGGKCIHAIAEFTTLIGGDLALWEGVTWDTGTGSQLKAVNRKREVPIPVSELLEDTAGSFAATGNVVLNPTNLATGSAVTIHHFYAWGEKNRIQAGGARDTEEILLEHDTLYAAVFTSGGASNKAQLILNWYEHLDGC